MTVLSLRVRMFSDFPLHGGENFIGFCPVFGHKPVSLRGQAVGFGPVLQGLGVDVDVQRGGLKRALQQGGPRARVA